MSAIEMLRPETPAEAFEEIIGEIELLEAQFAPAEIDGLAEEVSRQKPRGRSDQGMCED